MIYQFSRSGKPKYKVGIYRGFNNDEIFVDDLKSANRHFTEARKREKDVVISIRNLQSETIVRTVWLVSE